MARRDAVHRLAELGGFGGEWDGAAGERCGADTAALRIAREELDDFAVGHGLDEDDVVGVAICVGTEGVGDGAAQRADGVDGFGFCTGRGQADAGGGKAGGRTVAGGADHKLRGAAVARNEPEQGGHPVGAEAILALAAFGNDDVPSVIDRPHWAAAIAREDVAFQALVAQQELPLPLALELGKVRRDEALAGRLARDAAKLKPEQAYIWSLAMIHQRSPEAARDVLARRNTLPERVQYLIPVVLEHTFETGLGNVLADWDAKLGGKEHTDALSGRATAWW